jgi:hypothetical protein
MELLSGEDMAHLRNKIRQSSGSGLIPVIACSYLACQMLNAIKGSLYSALYLSDRLF